MVKPLFHVMAVSQLLLMFILAGQLPADAGVADVRERELRPHCVSEVLLVVSADTNRNNRLDPWENCEGVDRAVEGQLKRRIAFAKGKEIWRIALPPGLTVKQALRQKWSNRDNRIVKVEPNYLVSSRATPNDTRFSEQWGLHNTGQSGGTADADIDAPAIWDATTGSASTVVAVIDSGVDYLHPDLNANIWRNPGESGGGKESNGADDDSNGFVDDVYGWDFLQDDSDPSDSDSHGTHVAGVIAAVGNNSLGVAGVNWTAQVMVCRFLDADGVGSTFDAIEAINYAVANGAGILNNSWGGGGFSASLKTAIEAARDAGVIFIAAAGNDSLDNDQFPHYPASYEVENIVSVAATDHDDGLSTISNTGSKSVDMGAPGTTVLSTVPVYETLYSEDFQGASLPGFAGTSVTSSGASNLWGTVQNNIGFGGNVAARGDYANSTPYQGNANGIIVTTPALDTSGRRGVSLSFNFRYQVGDTDTFSAEVWDGSGWQELFSRSNSDNFTPSAYLFDRIDLDPYTNSNMQVRFRWISDGSDNNYFGAEVDDIEIRAIGSDYTNAYALLSGTSAATPHVSGTAALLLAKSPGLSVNALKARLLLTGDPAASLSQTLTGRRLNANNACIATDGLKVISPNGGDIWTLGSGRSIEWISFGGGSTVDIELLKGGVLQSLLADDVSNSGSYSWTISPGLPTDSDYQIRVNDGTNIDSSDANFSLELSNDSCSNAICLEDSALANGSTVGATGTGLTSSCSLGTDTNDVWYRYTPTVSEAVTLSLCGSLLADSTLALFDSCGGNELTCNDDFCGLRSEITYPMIANTTYLIRVAGFDAEEAQFTLSVNGGSGTCGPLCSPPPASDANNDCIVDILDFAVLASEWLSCNLQPADTCP